MMLVFLLAEATRGSRRWIDIGPFQFQPSEFGKLLFVLAIAGFLADRARRIDDRRRAPGGRARRRSRSCSSSCSPTSARRSSTPPRSRRAASSPARAGCTSLALAATGLAVDRRASLWFLPPSASRCSKPYQTERLTGFANPDRDPGGATYNVTQSITAVGSGGLDGRGVGGATPDAARLPARARDRLRLRLASPSSEASSAPRSCSLLYLLVVWRGLRVITVAGDLYGAIVAGGIVFGLPVPDLRQRRHDDGHRAGDGHPAAVRHRRRLVDGREPGRDRRPARRSTRAAAWPPARVSGPHGRSGGRLGGSRASRGRRSRTTGRCSSAGRSPRSWRRSSRGRRRLARPRPRAARSIRPARSCTCSAGAPTPRTTSAALRAASARGRADGRGADRTTCDALASRTCSRPTSSRARPGPGFPVAEIARARSRSGSARRATPLAARLPVLREAVCDRLIESFARRNAILGVAIFIPGADFPVLTLNQIRLVLRHRRRARRSRSTAQRLPGGARAPSAAGFGFRAVARQLLGGRPGRRLGASRARSPTARHPRRSARPRSPLTSPRRRDLAHGRSVRSRS